MNNRPQLWHIWLELAPQAQGWLFESQLRQTYKVVKTGSDSSTDKRSAVGVSVKGPQR